MQVYVDDVLGVPLSDEKPNAASSSGTVQSTKAPFWISISDRTSFRRLHRLGGYWYTAARTEEAYDLAGAVYNARCGVCWRLGAEEPQREITKAMEDGSDSSVNTDDETSSSSAS